MFIVDTNVISEARKGNKANAGVVEFLRDNRPADLYLTVQTVGEIRRGIENVRGRGDQSQAAALEAWLALIIVEYSDRILMFDAECGQLWGRLMLPDGSHPVDKQIAAIALIHGLKIATRNTRDFANSRVEVVNPFR